MEHLRSKLGLPQLPELTDYLTKYFKQGRRRRGETMNDYITRKTETYTRAQQSLARVLKAYGQDSSRWTSSTTRSSIRSMSRGYGPSTTETPSVPEGDEEAASHEAAGEEDQSDPWARASQGQQSEHESNQSSGAWDPWWDYDSWSHCSWRTDDADWTLEAPEILPDMIQGWYLLGDSGLDTGERNMILAALKQDFSFDRVAQELRNQWPDEDLRRRDLNNRQSGWWVEEEQLSDEEEQAWVSTEDLNDEGKALVVEAQEEAAKALAAVHAGRRTHREAREKQHQVRMSRKYFKPSYRTSSKGDGKGFQSKGNNTCLRCGGDHRTANCPKQTGGNASAAEPHSAPFVCFTEDASENDHGNLANDEQGICAAAPPSTSEVVDQGKAVLDGGATRTIGSVHALERLMELHYQNDGTTGLQELNLEEKPTFGFGNSTKNQCVSTAAFKIHADGREGRLQIHALDHGDGPVLFSISSLRALGAVIDFSEDLVCFRNLNANKVIQLERSSTGHQLLPLAQDWYGDSKTSTQPVPSLRDFI